MGLSFNLGQVQLGPILACTFDPKCQDEKKEKFKKTERKRKRKGGTINIVRVSVKASPAEGRRRLHSFNDAPHEGLLKSKGGCLGV